MKRWQLVAGVLPLWASLAFAQAFGTPAAPATALVQRLDAPVPLDLPLVDSDGRQVRLGDFFRAGRPVLLVLGYYRCPQLCGLLMHATLDALHDSGVSRRDVSIVAVSIDAQDTPHTARAKLAVYRAYADFLRGPAPRETEPDLHLLVGAPQDTARLARAVGLSYSRDSLSPWERVGVRAHAAGRVTPMTSRHPRWPSPYPLPEGEGLPAPYAHPAALIVLTPQGRVSRYLMGVRFDPGELGLALVQASQGRIGTLTDRIALLCAHIDARFGRHTDAVMNATRGVALLVTASLAGWCWRRRHRAQETTP